MVKIFFVTILFLITSYTVYSEDSFSEEDFIDGAHYVEDSLGAPTQGNSMQKDTMPENLMPGNTLPAEATSAEATSAKAPPAKNRPAENLSKKSALSMDAVPAPKRSSPLPLQPSSGGPGLPSDIPPQRLTKDASQGSFSNDPMQKRLRYLEERVQWLEKQWDRKKEPSSTQAPSDDMPSEPISPSESISSEDTLSKDTPSAFPSCPRPADRKKTPRHPPHSPGPVPSTSSSSPNKHPEQPLEDPASLGWERGPGAFLPKEKKHNPPLLGKDLPYPKCSQLAKETLKKGDITTARQIFLSLTEEKHTTQTLYPENLYWLGTILLWQNKAYEEANICFSKAYKLINKKNDFQYKSLKMKILLRFSESIYCQKKISGSKVVLHQFSHLLVQNAPLGKSILKALRAPFKLFALLGIGQYLFQMEDSELYPLCQELLDEFFMGYNKKNTVLWPEIKILNPQAHALKEKLRKALTKKTSPSS